MVAITATVPRAAVGMALALGLLAGCGQSDAPDDKLRPAGSPQVARVVPVEEALAGANVPTLDPHTMVAAEIGEVIGEGPRCEFRYTGAGGPVLAVTMTPDGAAGRGIVKLNGNFVLLDPTTGDGAAPEAGLRLGATPVRATISPDRSDEPEELDGARRQEAEMIFEVGERLRVGYRGFLDCMAEPPMRPSRR